MRYLRELPKHKIRMAVGILYTLLACGLTLYLIGEAGGVKDMIVCFCLAGTGGLMIFLPRMKFPVIADLAVHGGLFLLYGIYVFKKMFERTELPVHDLSGMIPGIWKINVSLICILFFLFLLLLQRASRAFVATGCLCFLLTVVNYYVYLFRGTSLAISDLLAFRTGLMVMGHYTYTISPELWKTILYFGAFILVGSKIDVRMKGWKYHAGVTLFALLGLWGSVFSYVHSPVWQTPGARGEAGNIIAGQKGYGPYYFLIKSASAGRVRRPFGYSEHLLTQTARDAEEKYSGPVSDQKPDIILIMNEAWSDLRVLGDLETNVPFSPFFDSLELNTVKGYTHVNILGGLTPNTEFEALTGDNMAFLDISAIPYQMQLKHPVASLATVLGEQGYHTVAMHPNSGASWNRTQNYDYLGFDEFVTLEDFTVDHDWVGGYISDDCNAEELIRRYENRDVSQPLFLFDVTIQNHAGYNGQTPLAVKTARVGNSSRSFRDVDTYLSLMRLSDNALQKLIEYFSDVGTPVILCMFGDHQPILQPAFYEAVFEGRELEPAQKEALQFVTPYFIWTNYDTDMREYGEISASMLGAALCETAQVSLPPYYKFLLNLHDEIPYLNRYNYGTYANDPLITKWACLQYGHLAEPDYRRDIYSLSREAFQ